MLRFAEASASAVNGGGGGGGGGEGGERPSSAVEIPAVTVQSSTPDLENKVRIVS